MYVSKKHKAYGMLGLVIAISASLLLYFTPLGNFLRSDLFGADTISQEKGLYLGGIQTTGSGNIVVAGTGSVLETDNNLNEFGEVTVNVYALGGGLPVNSLSGLIQYDPALLSASNNRILPIAGNKPDTVVTNVVKNSNGQEIGVISFSLDKTAYFGYAKEKVAEINFVPTSRQVQTNVSLKSIHFLNNPPIRGTTHFYLANTGGTQSNFVSKPLPIVTTGLQIKNETINSTNSGTVLKETRTFSDGSQLIIEKWTEKDQEGKDVDHTLETYKDPNGITTKTIHLIEYPDGTKLIIENDMKGNITETYYDADGNIVLIIHKYADGRITEQYFDSQGREIRFLEILPNGDRYERITTYDTGGRATVEEWWYKGGKLVKHHITYPDTSTLKETITYSTDGSYIVHSEYTNAQNKQYIEDRYYDAAGKLLKIVVIKDEINFGPDITLTNDNGNISVFVPRGTVPLNIGLTLSKVAMLGQMDGANRYFVSDGYDISAQDKNTGQVSTVFLKPVEITILYDDAATAAHNGKKRLEVTPMYLDPQSGKWIAIPRESIIQSQSGKYVFFGAKPGRYALLGTYEGGIVPVAPNLYKGGGGGYSDGKVTVVSGTKPSASVCTPAAVFKDIQRHWAENYIEKARLACIIDGKVPGVFQPNGLITRAELTKVAVNAFKKKIIENITEKPFRDVNLQDWHASYVATAKLVKMINGYPDGNFRPNALINRAEALKIMVGAGNIDTKNFANFSRFSDTNTSAWYAPYLGYAKNKGVVEGYKENGLVFFKPAQYITRAEAVKIMMEILDTSITD
ncbi:MAG: S-layer homology domain-containing protein [Candidatus Gracilibacteria bacterium]